MIEVFVLSLLSVILFTPFGFILTGGSKHNLYFFTKELIFGLILLSFIAILINFFSPLSLLINSIILLIPLKVLISERKRYLNLKFLKFLILMGFLLTLLITESNVYRPDAGLYHLPYIGILNSEKIIIGLSNLHFRYGHNSIIQHLSAISNNLFLLNNGIVFAQALIASSIIINFIYQINNYIKKKNYNFHFYYLIFVFIYIAYKMNRYSEYGNDAPAHFLAFFFISEILLFNKRINNNEFINNLFLTLFIIQNKITLIFFILFNFINLKNINLTSIIRNKKFLFLIFFFSIWIVKNILISGCALYPINKTCIKNLSWVNFEEIKNISTSSEVWTKGWPDRKKNLNNISKEKFLEDFNWIKTWSSKHFKYILNILFPYFSTCLLILFILSINNKIIFNKIDKKNYYYFFSILICSLIWFFKSPLYRYGYSYLIILLSFLFSFYGSNLQKYSNVHNIIFRTIVIMFLSVIIFKNAFRIYKMDNNYFNYPWPKYYSMKDHNIITNFEINLIENFKILTPEKNNYCMYTKNICGHYGIDKNFKINNYKSYIIFNKYKK